MNTCHWRCAQGLSKEEAVSKVWLTDQDGLITSKRRGMAQVVKGFARQGGDDPEGEKLLESVKRVSLPQMGDPCGSCSKRILLGALGSCLLFVLLALIAC